MATYVVSDIHGYFYRFQDALAKANFNEEKDTLYVLGDLTDRGPHSGEVLEWAYNCSANVHFLRGNHEDLMLSYFKDQKYAGEIFEDQEELEDFFYSSVWYWNGARKTWKYLMNKIPKAHREDILKWIDTWPLYYDIEVNGRRFILVHAGLAIEGMRFSDDRYEKGLKKWVKIPDIAKPQYSQSLLWIRANWILDNNELPCDVVFGHTPCVSVLRMLEDANDWNEIDGIDEIPIIKGTGVIHFGKGVRKHCIDSGRETLSILRLEDFKEFNSSIEEGD